MPLQAINHLSSAQHIRAALFFLVSKLRGGVAVPFPSALTCATKTAARSQEVVCRVCAMKRHLLHFLVCSVSCLGHCLMEFETEAPVAMM